MENRKFHRNLSEESRKKGSIFSNVSRSNFSENRKSLSLSSLKSNLNKYQNNEYNKVIPILKDYLYSNQAIKQLDKRSFYKPTKSQNFAVNNNINQHKEIEEKKSYSFII